MCAKILNLLATKHAKDCFITECLLGSGGARRMDAWGMRGTWMVEEYFGYEINKYGQKRCIACGLYSDTTKEVKILDSKLADSRGWWKTWLCLECRMVSGVRWVRVDDKWS